MLEKGRIATGQLRLRPLNGPLTAGVEAANGAKKCRPSPWNLQPMAVVGHIQRVGGSQGDEVTCNDVASRLSSPRMTSKTRLVDNASM